ncbi:MAG: endonuclease/exonuclease/phosphatase family protein [Anaerolineales bacterium]
MNIFKYNLFATPIIEVYNQHLNNDACQSITILSANLKHTWPKRDFPIARLKNFVSLISQKQADILLLQEVMRTEDTQVNQWLADQLNMNMVYSRTNGDRFSIRFEEGLAILSRFPVLKTEQLFLKSAFHPFVRRQALAAYLATPCGEILAISTHLSITPWQNRLQLQRIQTWIEGKSKSAVLGGDFNAMEHTQRIARLQNKWIDTLRQLHPHIPSLFTHKLKLPFGKEINQRLDYIFLIQGKPQWKILESGIELAHQFSDHLAVWTKLAPIYAYSP